VLTVCEAGVAEAGADRHHSPVVQAAHEGRLAQSLNDGVVMHQDRHFMPADGWNCIAQELRQIEALVLPIAGQVLPSLFDRSVLTDQTWASNAYERGELQAVLLPRRGGRARADRSARVRESKGSDLAVFAQGLR